MTNQMTAVSLFAGVGGFDLALERNGVNVVASVEIDKHAAKVLTRHFPKSTIFNDVKEVTGEQLINAGFNPSNGIITGGFPCQDLSVAGKRAGLAGQRSGLFYEIARLLNETKARYFILENVPGLLSSNSGNDMGAVTATLVELGYSLSWRILDAQHFGVPQRRRRVFIVGCLGKEWRSPSEILALVEGRRGYLAASKSKGKDATGAVASGVRTGRIAGTLCARDYKGLSSDDLLDNKAVIGYRKSKRAQSVEDDESWVEDAKTNTINTFDLGDTRTTEIVFHPHPWDGARVQHDEKINTLAARMGTGGNNVPMMATFPITGNAIGREDHNGPNGPATGEETDPMFTLTSTDRHAVAVAYDEYNNSISDTHQTLRAGTKQSTGVITSTVRRLTPVECERLQGFPDGWTEDQSDSHRYKQMGNAVAVPVAVPVVEWVVSRLVAHHEGRI